MTVGAQNTSIGFYDIHTPGFDSGARKRAMVFTVNLSNSPCFNLINISNATYRLPLIYTITIAEPYRSYLFVSNHGYSNYSVIPFIGKSA